MARLCCLTQLGMLLMGVWLAKGTVRISLGGTVEDLKRITSAFCKVRWWGVQGGQTPWTSGTMRLKGGAVTNRQVCRTSPSHP